MIYQILGWPRSRTAWLANFLTYGPSFCFHEGVLLKHQKRVRTVLDYRKLFSLYKTKYKYVGDANTLALLKQKYVIPGARVVIIERDKKEVESSVYGLGHIIEIPDLIEYPYNDNIIIKYEEIDDNLKEIWKFCLPGLQYNIEREYLLKNLNVQVQNINEYLDIKLDV
jgi:hypothetical protein